MNTASPLPVADQIRAGRDAEHLAVLLSAATMPATCVPWPLEVSLSLYGPLIDGDHQRVVHRPGALLDESSCCG